MLAEWNNEERRVLRFEIGIFKVARRTSGWGEREKRENLL